MDKLTDSQREKIQLLQKKVDRYQVEPRLCAHLTSEQCTMLAELQIIYDKLSKLTLTNDSAIFSIGCKAVKNKMNQFDATLYANMEPEQLYSAYLTKYKEAKNDPNEINRLHKLETILPEDNNNNVPNTSELISKT